MRSLPDFPWDSLALYKKRASALGLIDLSIGTPVDPVPQLIRDALAAAADSHGYPATYGTVELRAAIAGWLKRALAVEADPDAILPTIGSKELVAHLPFQLGLGAQDVVAIPAIAYPTYDVGAKLAGAWNAAELSRAKADAEMRMGRDVPMSDSYTRAIRAGIPDDGFVCFDITQTGYHAWWGYPTYEPRTLIRQSYQGTLGYAFPTAMGAKAGQPKKAVVSVSGDGGFGWTLQELATALGAPMHYDSASQIMDEIAALTPTFKGVSFEKLDANMRLVAAKG